MATRALDLPLGLFGILFIGGFVALSLGLALALRPFVKRRFGDEHNAVFDTGFSAVGTMYAIVAACWCWACTAHSTMRRRHLQTRPPTWS